MTVRLSDRSVATRLSSLPGRDRRLLVVLCTLGLLALLAGVVYALVLVGRMSGVLAVGNAWLYRSMTLHAATAFYYWLYFVQAGVVLAVVRLYTPDVGTFRWRRLGWVGCGLMVAGFLANQVSVLQGAVVTYVGLADLASSTRSTVLFYTGYLLLAFGLAALALVAVRTALAQKRRGERTWPSLLFASVLWWGLTAVSVVASINAYLPPLVTAAGFALETPSSYMMRWSVLFHNMHYLPLVSAVIVWYVVVEDATGVSVKQVYSNRFSKSIFAFYLLLVPPTSLYHMFLSPSVSDLMKTVGSVLALGMSVPTLLHFLVIVTSVETAARTRGQSGWLGWIRALPWRNPGFAAVGAAVACAAGGGILANVLVQHGFATLLSDTLFVPAYFHFFTAGTVTLTFLGGLVYVVPPLVRRRIRSGRRLNRLTLGATFGVFLFGVAGVVGGYLGIPRRTVAVSYGGATPDVWSTVLVVVAGGGFLMGLSLGLYAVSLLAVVARGVEGGTATDDYARVAWHGEVSLDATIVSGLVTVGVLLTGWVVLTVATDALITGLPLGALAPVVVP